MATTRRGPGTVLAMADEVRRLRAEKDALLEACEAMGGAVRRLVEVAEIEADVQGPEHHPHDRRMMRQARLDYLARVLVAAKDFVAAVEKAKGGDS